METSRLGRLPPELRNNTFEIIVIMPTSITIRLDTDYPQTIGNEASMKDAFALMATCKQIQQECLPTFFTVNRFIASGYNLDDNFDGVRAEDGYVRAQIAAKTKAFRLRGWLHSLGQSATHLRSITIDLGIWDTYWGMNPTAADSAWVVERFNDVFKGSKVDATFSFGVNWEVYPKHPRIAVELSVAHAEHDQKALLTKFDRTRNSLLAQYDKTLDKCVSNHLNDCEDEMHWFFSVLRRLPDATESVTGL